MECLIIIIVSLVFVCPVFVLFLPRSPAMKKFVFFRLAIFLPPKKKNPRGDAAGESLPQNRQKGKTTHLRGFCCHAWPFLLAVDLRLVALSTTIQTNGNPPNMYSGSYKIQNF